MNPFQDEGDYTEIQIELEDFTQIEIYNIFNIEIIQDDKLYAIYKGGDRILDEMTHSSISGILKLDHNYINWSKNFDIPTIEIHTPLVEGIKLNSSGNIKSLNQLSGEKIIVNIYDSADTFEIDLNINHNNLEINTQGSTSGTFTIRGICTNTKYSLNGSTNIQASELISKEVNVSHNSFGNAHIFAQDKLSVTFYKSGDLYYKGNPKEIEVKHIQINNQDFSGKLIKE
jgi:hypothetical protein